MATEFEEIADEYNLVEYYVAGPFFIDHLGTMSDAATVGRIASWLYEVRAAADSVPALKLTSHLTETPKITDSVQSVARVLISETPKYAETQQISRYLLVQDTRSATETVTPKTIATKTLLDGLEALDAAYVSKKATLLEAAQITDSVTFSSQILRQVFDALAAAEVVTQAARVGIELDDELEITDAALPSAQTSSSVTEDLLYVEDSLVPTSSEAWTANTDGWQMSKYDRLPMGASLAALGGYRYTGALTGLTKFDQAVAVSGATFTSLWSDLGDDHLKLPRSLYLGYTSEQPLTVTMFVTKSGQDFGYPYVMPAQLADSMLPGRLMLGRGLRSRYFKYQVENTGGGYFYIDTALIDADVSTRRI
jgi:hypothetical protein